MARGSMRNRGGDAWELRIYRGVHPETGRQVWSTKTVHGSRRYAAARLREFSDAVDEASTCAGTVGDLLERWFAASSPQWAPPTVAQTRSVLRRHLLPNLGHLPVGKLTTADIDDFYGVPPPFGWPRGPCVVGGHRPSHPRRAPSRARSSVAVGLGLDQPGDQREAAEVSAR